MIVDQASAVCAYLLRRQHQRPDTQGQKMDGGEVYVDGSSLSVDCIHY